MNRTDVFQSIIRQPDAVKIIEDAQSFLEKEKSERRQFHDLVHENMKAEL